MAHEAQLTCVDDMSPANISLVTPSEPHSTPSSPIVNPHPYPPHNEFIDLGSDAGDGFDFYGTYGRPGIYAAAERRAKADNRSSMQTDRSSISSNGVVAVNAARVVLQNRGGDDRATSSSDGLQLELDQSGDSPRKIFRQFELPKTPSNAEPVSTYAGLTGRSVATGLRLRIQRERQRPDDTPETVTSTPMPALRVVNDTEEPLSSELEAITSKSESSKQPVSAGKDNIEAGDVSQWSHEDSYHIEQTTIEHQQESDSSTLIVTPHPPNEVTFTAPSPPIIHDGLLASPLPLDDNDQKTAIEPPSSPSFVPPFPPPHSLSLTPNSPSTVWPPGSPASPHSIAATQQAVEAHRQTPEGKRPRGLTLVGRMEADLNAAKGPVPITFLIGGSGASSPKIGLGLPSAMGRTTPEARRAKTPTPLDPPMPDDIHTKRLSSSRFPPVPVRGVTSPEPIPQIPYTPSVAPVPKPGFFPARTRSRSFSATVAKSFGRSQKENTPPLAVDTTAVPPVPAVVTPQSAKRSFFSKPGPSTPDSPAASILSRTSTAASMTQRTPSASTTHFNDSNSSLPIASARSSSFSFSSKGSKAPRKVSRVLPNPVSHRDFEETVQADGMDFEIVKPTLETPVDQRTTIASGSSSGSLRAPLPETDEWGFLKEKSPTPEIFQSRNAPGDHRVSEQKWVRRA